jgi:predicted SprT family Zn-dependent metalloprotease
MMDLMQARRLARSLMNEHGLREWRLMFDHARRRFGACHYAKRTITLSRVLVPLNDEAQVRDTVLHEIAHALTPGDGHGARWKRKCLELGAEPARCYRDEEVVAPERPAAKYLWGCAGCDWWVERRRVARRAFACAKCRAKLVYRARVVSGESAVRP